METFFPRPLHRNAAQLMTWFWPCMTSSREPSYTMLGLWLQTCQLINGCCVKPLNLWSFVMQLWKLFTESETLVFEQALQVTGMHTQVWAPLVYLRACPAQLGTGGSRVNRSCCTTIYSENLLAPLLHLKKLKKVQKKKSLPDLCFQV